MKNITCFSLLFLFSFNLYSQKGMISRCQNEEGGYDYTVMNIHRLSGVSFKDVNRVNFINVNIVDNCDFEYYTTTFNVPAISIYHLDTINNAMLNFAYTVDSVSARGPTLINVNVVRKW